MWLLQKLGAHGASLLGNQAHTITNSVWASRTGAFVKRIRHSGAENQNKKQSNTLLELKFSKLHFETSMVHEGFHDDGFTLLFEYIGVILCQQLLQ